MAHVRRLNQCHRREKEPERMLHLNDERRLVMGQAVYKYFRIGAS